MDSLSFLFYGLILVQVLFGAFSVFISLVTFLILVILNILF